MSIGLRCTSFLDMEGLLYPSGPVFLNCIALIWQAHGPYPFFPVVSLVPHTPYTWSIHFGHIHHILQFTFLPFLRNKLALSSDLFLARIFSFFGGHQVWAKLWLFPVTVRECAKAVRCCLILISQPLFPADWRCRRCGCWAATKFGSWAARLSTALATNHIINFDCEFPYHRHLFFHCRYHASFPFFSFHLPSHRHLPSQSITSSFFYFIYTCTLFSILFLVPYH